MSDSSTVEARLANIEDLILRHYDGPGESQFRFDELMKEIRAEVSGKDAEPVAWEYRWLNPGNNSNVTDEMLAWKRVEPKGLETVEQQVRDLPKYLYQGKPCYEMRTLYAAMQSTKKETT